MSSHVELIRCADDNGEDWSLVINPMVVNDEPYYHIMMHVPISQSFNGLSIVARHARFRNVESRSDAARFITFRFAPNDVDGADDSLMVSLRIAEMYSANLGGLHYSISIDSWAIGFEVTPPNEICRVLLNTLDQLCGHLPPFVEDF